MPNLTEYQFAVMLAEKARQFSANFGDVTDPVTPPLTVKVTAGGESKEITFPGPGG